MTQERLLRMDMCEDYIYEQIINGESFAVHRVCGDIYLLTTTGANHELLGARICHNSFQECVNILLETYEASHGQ